MIGIERGVETVMKEHILSRIELIIAGFFKTPILGGKGVELLSLQISGGPKIALATDERIYDLLSKAKKPLLHPCYFVKNASVIGEKKTAMMAFFLTHSNTVKAYEKNNKQVSKETIFIYKDGLAKKNKETYVAPFVNLMEEDNYQLINNILVPFDKPIHPLIPQTLCQKINDPHGSFIFWHNVVTINYAIMNPFATVDSESRVLGKSKFYVESEMQKDGIFYIDL